MIVKQNNIHKNHQTINMKNAFLISLLIIIPIIGTISCKNSSHESVVTLTADNFSNETSAGIVLVDFWATWCMPCKAMSPVINELASQTKGKIKIGKIDIDKEPGLAKQFNIQAIPTLVILKDGIVVDTHTGLISKEALIALLEKHISLQ